MTISLSDIANNFEKKIGKIAEDVASVPDEDKKKAKAMKKAAKAEKKADKATRKAKEKKLAVDDPEAYKVLKADKKAKKTEKKAKKAAAAFEMLCK